MSFFRQLTDWKNDRNQAESGVFLTVEHKKRTTETEEKLLTSPKKLQSSLKLSKLSRRQRTHVQSGFNKWIFHVKVLHLVIDELQTDQLNLPPTTSFNSYNTYRKLNLNRIY